MFDTMTMTKVVGGVCGSLLVFLLIGFAGEKVFATPGHGAGHGEGAVEQAYVIETGAEEAPATEADAGPPADLDAQIAAADPAAGEKVFAKCKACHKIDGSDGTGPHLDGVVNRNKGAAENHGGYSDAILAVKDQTWTPANLYSFLENPKGYMPGTKMSFAGLPKSGDRVAIIAYLATLK